MATFVHNDSGSLFREVLPVGQTFTVTPKMAGCLRRGAIFMREFGEDKLTVVSRDELENEFTGLSDD